MKYIRTPTLKTIGIKSVLELLEEGSLPAVESLVEEVFGPPSQRGSLVISGGSGIVGAGKAMQLGSRLTPHGVRIVALDLAGAPDGLGKQFPGLVKAFGKDKAGEIMANISRFSYDGKSLPQGLKELRPRFLLEAIPEILELKKNHYEMFRKEFPQIEIRSVTSGFPSSELGVPILHPAFPHEINKIFEAVEPSPSSITRLLWALGLIPIPVSDHWSFVLDVFFCGLTLAGTAYHRSSNMPFWKIDKYIRKILGPNPFRAHDAIGAQGANFLTWSCLHHLSQHYGRLFEPTPELVEHKESGQDWYPLNHLRPLVNWTLGSIEEENLNTWISGPLFQMAALMVQEKRAHLSHLNIIGELCAQFRRGTLAQMRALGKEKVIDTVEKYHQCYPQAKSTFWNPEVLSQMESPEWNHLYVNGEHNGTVGVITFGRESYNQDVDLELNRTIEWLKTEGIKKVILTGDFHLATQLVGADTSEFFPALDNRQKGMEISQNWSETARRFQNEFETSIALIEGKRCLGGFLELLLHCHYVVAQEEALLGFPEVNIPVIPGMEGCHWPFRKTPFSNWPRLLELLLEGRPIPAGKSVGWLVDYAGPREKACQMAWKLATGGDHGIQKRSLEEKGLKESLPEIPLSPGDADKEGARKALFQAIRESCEAPLEKALLVQSNHSADFMSSKLCQKGQLGKAYEKSRV